MSLMHKDNKTNLTNMDGPYHLVFTGFFFGLNKKIIINNKIKIKKFSFYY